jgi:hypothetical protein
MSTAVHQISSLSTPTIPASLSPEQAQVVTALAQGQTVTRAAAAVGVHRTTVHHWLRTSPDFKAAVASAKGLYAACLADELTELSAAALKTLRTLLEAPETHPAIRLKTALAILERPQFPSAGWQLPADIAPPHERRITEDLSLLEADCKRLRLMEAAARSQARDGSNADDRAGSSR